MPKHKTHAQAAAVASCLVLAGTVTALADQAAPAAPAPEPKPKWETSAGLAFSLTQGNSDTILFTANIQTLRKFEQGDLRMGADLGYGENDDVKNIDYEKGFAQYNHALNERWYGYARLDLLHDDIADVNYRITLSPGVGYYFMKSERTRLSAEFGPSVVFEEQGGDEQTYLALRLAERLEHKFNDRARMWQSLEILPQVDEFDNYILNAELGVEADLTKRMALRVVLQDTYDNEPAPGREKNDFKALAGVQYKF